MGSGGTLGGYGSVTGDVTNSGVIAPGSATQVIGSPMGRSPYGNYSRRINSPRESIGNVLSSRHYGGTMAINTVLGGDGSPSDRLVISGGAATATPSVHVTNVGGGARKHRQRHSGGERGQRGDDRAWGVRASAGELRAGAFDYDLFRGGVGGASPNDWFLRSDFVAVPAVVVAAAVGAGGRASADPAIPH